MPLRDERGKAIRLMFRSIGTSLASPETGLRSAPRASAAVRRFQASRRATVGNGRAPSCPLPPSRLHAGVRFGVQTCTNVPLFCDPP